MHTEVRSAGPDTVVIEVTAPVQTHALGIVRSLFVALATHAGFPPEDVDKIELAVDEACTNVVRHAYKHLGVSPDLPPDQRREPPPGTECTLRLHTVIHPDYMRISIIDHGIGLHRTPPGVNSIAEYLDRKGQGGLGNYIIKNFMDEVKYEFPDDAGTILTMTKYLSPSASPSQA